MPQFDGTGKRRSGTYYREQAARRAAEERRREMEARGGALPPPAPGEVPGGVSAISGIAPPPQSSVADAIAWASIVQGRIAELAISGTDPARVGLITAVVKSLSKIRGSAADSENWARAKLHYHGEVVEIHGEAAPSEPAAVAAWAFWRMVAMIWAACCAADDSEIDEGEAAHRVRALVAVGAVFPASEMDKLIASIEGTEDEEAPAGGVSTSRERARQQRAEA